MKSNFFLLIIAAALTALIGYAVYAYSVEPRKVLSTVIFSISFFGYVAMLLGVSYEYSKAHVVKNVTSLLFAFYSLGIGYFFIQTEYSIPLYLIANGVPLLIYGVIINFFTKAKY
jgi:hypothetical protein